MSARLISVVIPTRERNATLALCLDRLAPGAQTLPHDQYEVIVADDSAGHLAFELVRDRYPWARWQEGPRRGPAANRNAGARAARGTWLVFTDDDCLPDPIWLEAYAAAMNPNEDRARRARGTHDLSRRTALAAADRARSTSTAAGSGRATSPSGAMASRRSAASTSAIRSRTWRTPISRPGSAKRAT